MSSRIDTQGNFLFFIRVVLTVLLEAKTDIFVFYVPPTRTWDWSIVAFLVAAVERCKS